MAWQPDYVTTSEFKAQARITDSDDDAQIAFAITAASRAVDRAANRQFGLVSAAEARYYTAKWSKTLKRQVVYVDDFQTTTDLVIKADMSDDGTYEETLIEYALRPINSDKTNRPWTMIVVTSESSLCLPYTEGAIEVTAKYGWTTVPTAIKQATIIQAQRFLKRRDAPFGVAGSAGTSETRLLERVDPDVIVAIGPYTRQEGIVA